MLPEIATLARLEKLDAQTHQLQVRLTELPKILTAEKKAVEAQKKQAEDLQAKLAANEKERRSLEGDIQLRQTKLKKLRLQIEQATNETQLQAFQHEIQFGESEIGKNEDRTLELMEEAEALEPQLKAGQATLAAAQKAGLEHFKAAEQEHKAGMAQIAKNAETGKELVASLAPQYAQLYERLRKKYKTGPILCEAIDGNCGVCQMALRLAFWQGVKAEPDKLWQCEECSRILVYNPSVMLA
jgi:predicted  nucleic acid-binding Zn-ribbon protein